MSNVKFPRMSGGDPIKRSGFPCSAIARPDRSEPQDTIGPALPRPSEALTGVIRRLCIRSGGNSLKCFTPIWNWKGTGV